MRLFRRAPKPRASCTPADIPGRPPLLRLEGAAKEAIETGRTRLVIAGMLFATVFVILAGRLVDVTLLRGGSETSSLRGVDPLEKGLVLERQSIVDRNGIILATNLRTASLYCDPRKVLNPQEAAAQLVQVLPDLSQAEVLNKLTSGKSFAWLKRNLTPKQQYAVNRLGIPGFQFQDEQRRVYPQAGLAAHVLGFTDVDGRGIAGIEQFFDETLRDPARNGDNFQMSIDVRVQHALRDEMQKAVSYFNAVGGGGIVLDVNTGEVLAMVSVPDFDPTAPGEGLRTAEAGRDARFNRMTLGVYEMGSTMKTLNTAMVLDNGVVRLNSTYNVSNPIQIARFTIKDDHPMHRSLTVPEIYMYSSNIGSAKMAVDAGATMQRDFMFKMGMLRKPSIEIPEVGAPLVPKNWKVIETMTIAFGHGLSVSPLQLASATAAIINGGVLHPATLVKRGPDQPVPGVRVIKAETSDTMRRLMHLVVDTGTGKQAGVDGYLVGGKTGTSEKVSAHGGYNHKSLLTTFVGVFPMSAPRYVVLGTLDEPKGRKETYGVATAGWNSAPTVGKVITRIAPLLGIEPVNENSPDIKNAMYVNVSAPAGPNPYAKPEHKVAAN